MAPCKRQVKAMGHFVCDHIHSLVDIAVSECGRSWAETTEEGFSSQCLGCWKVDSLTADIARLTDIVKEMEMGMTKGTTGREVGGSNVVTRRNRKGD